MISTVAGILQTSGSTGDGGLATSAYLRATYGVCVDSAGNIYIADAGNSVIRKVNASDGKINTIAGTNGVSGASGDGGFATNAKLNGPNGVFVDVSNNIYIVDTFNSAIRKVNASDGKINTVAGTLGVSGANGDLGLATSAKLYNPTDVFVDASNNIYIADTMNSAVRKVNASDGKINTVAGTNNTSGSTGDGGFATNAKLSYPYGVYLDASNNIYITDTGNHVVRKVNASDGKINTVVGIIGSSGSTGDGGAANFAKLNDPHKSCVDSSGNIYIADYANSVIRKMNGSNGIINTIAGVMGSIGWQGDGGIATSAKLYQPGGVYVDANGIIYISDTWNYAIRKVQ